MTMASATPSRAGPNAAHDVRPMNGGIFQPSTATSTSVRGNETFTVPPSTSALSAPVAAFTAASSIGLPSFGAAGGAVVVTVETMRGSGFVPPHASTKATDAERRERIMRRRYHTRPSEGTLRSLSALRTWRVCSNAMTAGSP
jgi:hypothetical protein